MANMVRRTANDAVEEVHYVLTTTFNSFSPDWERYKDDFEDIGASHLGREGKYSLEAIIGEHESLSFAYALKDVLELFIGESALPKFNSPGNPEKFLLLVKNFFSYLHKTTEWFDAIFSDFDDVAWPIDDRFSYSEASTHILHEAFYGGIREKIRDSYFKQCEELRQRYSYESMDVFHCFYKKLIVPLFGKVIEWERRDEAAFWWQPLDDEFEKIVRDKMTKVDCDERSFVTLASCCMQAELFMIDYLPDNREQSNCKRMKEKLEDVICKLYWERRDRSFIGLLSKNNFDRFLFEKLLKMLVISPKQKDLFMMRLRSQIRMHFELRALELVPVVPNQPLTLEELKPFLTELEETKQFLWERLEEKQDKYPFLQLLRGDFLDNCREQLEIYQIDEALDRTDGKFLRRLQEKVKIGSAFREEAKLIALYIKHLARSGEFMNELEAFAEANIARNQHEMVSTLVEFVSMHKYVCSNALFTILYKAMLIRE